MMKKAKIMTVIALSSVLFVNCFYFKQYTGDEREKAVTNEAMQTVKQRAEFDMECSEVKTQQLGDVTVYGDIAEFSIGARGCNKKATYLVRCTVPIKTSMKIPCTSQLNSITKPQSEGATEDFVEDPVVE